MTCNFCKTGLGEAVYRPWLSERGAKVHVCPNCGLVQTVVTGPLSRDIRISCDADWRNVRQERPEMPGVVNYSHRLEHQSNPAQFLQQLMPPYYLEVPNLSAINDPFVVEEFFTDPHLFHFDHDLLVSYLHFLGRVIDKDESDQHHIRLLVRHGDKHQRYFGVNPEEAYRAIGSYAERLMTNRELLAKVVERFPFRASFWGAGTIFDALVKYGGFSPFEHLTTLVDTYLNGIGVHGVPVQHPDVLKDTKGTVVILARSGNDEIVRALHGYGVENILTFNKIMENLT